MSTSQLQGRHDDAKTRALRRRLVAASLILSLGSSGALAQTASQITPATVRPQAPAQCLHNAGLHIPSRNVKTGVAFTGSLASQNSWFRSGRKSQPKRR